MNSYLDLPAIPDLRRNFQWNDVDVYVQENLAAKLASASMDELANLIQRLKMQPCAFASVTEICSVLFFIQRVVKNNSLENTPESDLSWALEMFSELQARLSKGSSAKTILSSLETITVLLEVFLGDAINRRGNFLDGKLIAKDAMKADLDAAQALAELLSGKGAKVDDFLIQPWNSPEQMGAYLVTAYDLECPPEEAAFTIVMSALNEAYREMDFIAEHSLDPEEHAWRIEGIIELYAHALTGTPYPSDESE